MSVVIGNTESLRSEDEYENEDEDYKNSIHNHDRIKVNWAYHSSFSSSSLKKSLRSEDENEYEDEDD